MTRPIFAPLITAVAQAVQEMLDVVTYNFGSTDAAFSEASCPSSLDFDGTELLGGAVNDPLTLGPTGLPASDESIQPSTFRQRAVVQNVDGYPRLGMTESDGPPLRNLAKYEYINLQMGSKAAMNNRWVANDRPNLGFGLYYPWNETQQYNSPQFSNGTGTWFSHGPAFTEFGDSTIGGNPTNASIPRQLWLGHLLYNIGGTLTAASNTGVVGTNQTISVNDASRFVDNNGNDMAALVIWDTGSLANQFSNPVGSFPNGAMYYITGVNVGANTVTVRPAQTDTGVPVGPLTSHPSGAQIRPISFGQGSDKRNNWAFDVSTARVDASGNDWAQFLTKWMYTFSFNDATFGGTGGEPWMTAAGAQNVDASGNPVAFEWVSTSHDVTEDYHHPGSERHDHTGDNVEDKYVVNNDNLHREQIKYFLNTERSLFPAGLPQGTGGTKEVYHNDTVNIYDSVTGNFAEFGQIEFLGSGAQKTLDEDFQTTDFDSEVYRAIQFGEEYATHQTFGHVLSKLDNANQFDATTTELAVSMYSGLAFNKSNVTFSGANNDQWFDIYAVDNNGIGQPNVDTPAAQQNIVDNLGWLGQPLTPPMIIGADAFIATNEIANFDFVGTGTDQGFTFAGGYGGPASFTGTAQGLQIQNNDHAFAYGTYSIRSPEVLVQANQGANSEVVVVIDAISRDPNGSVVRVSIGNSANQKNLREIYISPNGVSQHVLATTVEAADVSSGARRRIFLQPSRSEDVIEIKRIKVYFGDDINPMSYIRYFENGTVITNNTPRAQTYTLGHDHRVPTVADNSVPTFAAGDMGVAQRSFTIPGKSATGDYAKSLILQKVDPGTIEDDFSDFINANGGVTSGVTVDGVQFCVPEGDGVNYGPLTICDEDGNQVVVQPTVVTSATCPV